MNEQKLRELLKDLFEHIQIHESDLECYLCKQVQDLIDEWKRTGIIDN